MAIQSVNNYSNTSASSYSSKAAKTNQAKNETGKTENTNGVVYEKNNSSSSDSVKSVNSKTQNSALVAQMKADTANRMKQLQDIVSTMMSKQGIAIGKADDMWSFLAKGDFTVDAATKAQAQADIAEDGYWGVEQTSDRIIDFAKALSGNDPAKMEKMVDAFKKGFQEATKSWGKSLPDISQRTYDAVMEKFDKWKQENGVQTES